MREIHNTLEKFEIHSKILYGKEIKGLARNSAELFAKIQAYLQTKFGLTADESRAVISASNYKNSDTRIPEDLEKLANAGMSKINWEEVPERLDDNISQFPKKS